ncbi:cytochrome c biogenesis CcdA family protein [Streptomyces aidingensis]|uniref:Cytochrome c biogenesis protein CcdA n=1 Tax=Streptomyces aidingensis TaxID=910347 RepID=A0A1I1FDD8_9ACTN|nr:cytochrome c biogenesis CcdA family protein [Streptomyces aidingensis]SFB95153.1 Cytochrome c biogenesis protein CcdA [Streptomyces aidingensis]
MDGVPFALAFTAGMLAAVNPCGFALLPAYLGLFVGGAGQQGDGAAGRAGALRRAAVATGAMTAGFTLVFGAFGLVVSPLALSVERWLPWVTVVIGALLLATGGWLLTGRELGMALPKAGPAGRNPTESARGMAVFGVSYAIASLSCTVGPFLAITATAFRGSNVPGVITVFLAYAGGMGAVVGVLTLGAALSRQAVATWLRRALPYVTRVSGALLLVAGGYIAYYGWYEIRLLNGELAGDDPVIRWATGVQGDLTRLVNDLGPWRVGAALAVLLAATAAVTATARRHHRTDPTTPTPTP